MKIALAALVAVATVPALADARPMATAGVGLGRTQSKAEADTGANDTMQVFGRLSFTPRVGLQAELQKIHTPSEEGMDVRTGTLLLVVDLATKGHLIPIMFGGLGFDRATDSYGYDTHGTHKEGGLGLEYRADGGFTIGADFRLGGRSVDPTYKAQPTVLYTDTGAVALYAPVGLQSGEYRSARLYAAIRF